MKKARTEWQRRLRASLLGKLKRGKPVWQLDGRWSRNGNLCHREYTTLVERSKAFRKIGHIVFTDGTRLELSVRLIHGKDELLDEKDGYGDLINLAIASGKNTVEEINAYEKERRARL